MRIVEKIKLEDDCIQCNPTIRRSKNASNC